MPPEAKPADTPGRRLLAGGWAYWRAALLFHEHDQEQEAWPIVFVLLGFALELGLKGYLRESGVDRETLRELGHDLLKCFGASVGAGFRPSHPAMEELVRELSPHIADVSLRYLEGTSVELPPLPHSVATTCTLLLDLNQQSG